MHALAGKAAAPNHEQGAAGNFLSHPLWLCSGSLASRFQAQLHSLGLQRDDAAPTPLLRLHLTSQRGRRIQAGGGSSGGGCSVGFGAFDHISAARAAVQALLQSVWGAMENVLLHTLQLDDQPMVRACCMCSERLQ